MSLPFQFWLLVGEAVAAVTVAALAIKLFPNPPPSEGESDIAENARQEKALKDRLKKMKGWK